MKLTIKKIRTTLPTLVLLLLLAPVHSGAESYYDEGELSSKNLVLPEMEQFRLGSKLFLDKNKKIASWKAFQTFMFNYPDSPLAGDVQFMIAESIFSQAVQELQMGNPPDETAWRKQKKSGFKATQNVLKKGFEGLRKFGAEVSGEEAPTPEPDLIDYATFSEAIEQYQVVLDKHKRSGLSDAATFRIAECYYNMGDYPSALANYKKVQNDFPHSYLAGEAILGAAQCYIPGGDFGSAELGIKKLIATYPTYRDQPQVQYILGIIRFQEGKYDGALEELQKIDTPEALYYSGQSLIKMGKSLMAIAKFKKIIDEFKSSRFAEQAAYLIGESFFFSRNYVGAIQEYKKFLTLYPQSSLKEGALYKIAASYFMNKDYPACRESFNLLLNTYPTGDFASLARYFIAESYRMARQYKEASFAYGELISQLPNAPITANARFKLAWVTYLQGNYSGAVDAFQKYLDWHPFHAWVPQAHLIMGNCYTKLGRPDDAANSYQQAFDRAPKTELAESAMALLNRTRYLQGNYGQLTSAYTYILKSLPPSESKWRAVSQTYLADSYYRQKLYKDSISVFQSVVSLYPNMPVAANALDGLSWCYFQLGDYDQSTKYREKVNNVRLPEGQTAPQIASGGFELANAFFNQKKYPQALENYQKFLKDNPDSKDAPVALYRIGMCYYRQEYYTQAIESWENLAKQYPDNPKTEEAVFQVADTYFRAQKYDKAVETYRRIMGRYPKNPQIGFAALRIGQSYYNAGDDNNAVSSIESFLRKFPDDPKSVDSLDLLESSLDRREQAGGDKQAGISLLRGMIDSFPKSALAAECQFRIARRLFSWKSYSDAAQEFQKVTLNYADSSHVAESQFYAGESLYLTKSYPDAVTAYQTFLRNFPSSDFAAAATFHLGTCFYNTGDLQNAINNYQNLLQQFPSSEYASAGLFNLALSQKKLQKLAEAADSYLKLALNYPKDPNVNSATLEVGKIRNELKQYGDAILVLKDLDAKLPAGDEMKLETALEIAKASLGNNDTDGAIDALKTASALPPADSGYRLEVLKELGDLYVKKDMIPDAIKVYDEGAKYNQDFKALSKYYRENLRGSGGSSEDQQNDPPKKKHNRTTSGGE